MIKLQKIPTLEQLMQLANSFNEILIDVKKEDVSVVFELEKDMVRQIDEEIFYKNNTSKEKPETIEQPDEVQVSILGLTFKFVQKNGNSQ